MNCLLLAWCLFVLTSTYSMTMYQENEWKPLHISQSMYSPYDSAPVLALRIVLWISVPLLLFNRLLFFAGRSITYTYILTWIVLIFAGFASPAYLLYIATSIVLALGAIFLFVVAFRCFAFLWLSTSGIYALIFILVSSSVTSTAVSVLLTIIELALYFSFLWVILVRLHYISSPNENVTDETTTEMSASDTKERTQEIA